MVRINLLPSGRKKSMKLAPVITYGAVVTFILIIVMIAVSVFMNSKISDMEDENFAKEQKLKELQVALEEVRNYERDNKEFREKTRIIEELKKKQIVPLRLLDEVSEMLPKGVWLTSLRDRNGVISISGYAFSNPDLVSYVQNLKKSRYLTNVTLVESRQDDIEEFSVYNFKLTLMMKF